MSAHRILALALAIASFALPASAVDLSSPVGRWRTVDDETNVERSIVEIVQVGGELQGKVLQLLNRRPGESNDPVCEKCEGARKNQKIIGLTFLWGLKPDGDEWTGGAVLDPENGKIYKAKISLADGGQKLRVRGFIGMSLFGRTQVWLRQP
jgi:uncharacterized protein (DUF2147 family)